MGADYKPSHKPPQFDGNEDLNQAAPVQNTYYPIVNIVGPGRIYDALVRVDAVGETLEARLTIDGTVYGSTTVACGIGVNNRIIRTTIVGVLGVLCAFEINTVAATVDYGWLLEFKHGCLIEVRKTTANGAGNLRGRVLYGTY